MIDGSPVIDYVATTLESAGFQVTLLAPDLPHLRGLGRPILPDLTPDQGPMAAVAGAFQRMLVERFLVVACDMPFCTVAACRALWEASQTSASAHFAGSPLPGVYRRTLLPTMTRLLAEGRHGLRELFLAPEARPLEILPPPTDGSFRNINTPEDWTWWQAGQT